MLGAKCIRYINSLDTQNSKIYGLDPIFITIFKDKEAEANGIKLPKVTTAENAIFTLPFALGNRTLLF